MQWGETYRDKFPLLPNQGAGYHFPEDYKLGFWDPSKTKWKSSEWESFRDPHKLTYRSYHEVQSEREASLEAVVVAARAERALDYLDPQWVEVLRMFFAPMRFAEWGVSMAHQYVGRFAISGLITNCALLQWFDELRHTQRIAEWSRDLDAAHGGFGDYRKQWLEASMFQPLREFIERVCVVKDWGEIVVATNLVLEPLLQPVFLTALSDLGNAHRDSVLPHLSYSFRLDEVRHWDWARALAEMLHRESSDNAEMTAGWVEAWWPLGERAVAEFGAVFTAAGRSDLFEHAYGAAAHETRDALEAIGVSAAAAPAAGSAAPS